MTPTEIEKLKERTKDRAQYLGQGTGCGHVSCAELYSLIAALEAAQTDNTGLAIKLRDTERKLLHELTRAEAAEAALKEARHRLAQIRDGVRTDGHVWLDLGNGGRERGPPLYEYADALLSKQGE